MDKIIKYLDKSEETINKLINLKRELKEESPETQRYIFYDYKQNQRFSFNGNSSYSPITKKYSELLDGNLLRKFIHDDDKICVCTYSYTPMFNKVIFFKSKWEEGLTYDKKTKKVKLWGASTLDKCSYLIKNMLIELKHEWFLSLPDFFKENLTKTLLENILNGKITNPEDYIKKYMKTSLKYSFHYKLIKKWFEVDGFYFKKDENFVIPKGKSVYDKTFLSENKKNFVFLSQHYGFNRGLNMKYIKDYTVEPNFSMQKILSGELSQSYLETLNDMFNQCKLLGEKVNLHWSYNRLQEEHLKFTRKIASIRFINADLENVKYFGTTTNPELIKYEIVNNEKMAFEEGNEMHNCVYTNYWSRVKDKEYFIFKVTYPERCTVGVSKTYWANDNKDRFFIEQAYIRRNRPVKPETKLLLIGWISSKEMQNFFVMNYKTYDEKDIKTLEEIEIEELSLKKKAV